MRRDSVWKISADADLKSRAKSRERDLYLQGKQMKNKNILIGALSGLCVILIAVIAFLGVRSLNLADSASGNPGKVRESTASDGTGSGTKDGSSEGKNKTGSGGTGNAGRTEGAPGNGGSLNGRGGTGESQTGTGGTGESQTGTGGAGESRTDNSGTDPSGSQGASGGTASGEYEVDGVLYMADGRPVYEYLEPPLESVVDYCPFGVEDFIASVASVYRMAHDNGFEYGNSGTLPPCEDGLIACDRLIARALWDLGYTDQPQGGMQIVSGDLTEEQYLVTHGFIKINDPSKLMRGDIVLQDDGTDGEPKYTWHTFVLVEYDPVTQICSKYDCGHFTPEGIDRVSSEQPFTCPLADFGDRRRFVCAFRIRSEMQPAE